MVQFLGLSFDNFTLILMNFNTPKDDILETKFACMRQTFQPCYQSKRTFDIFFKVLLNPRQVRLKMNQTSSNSTSTHLGCLFSD